MVLYVLQILRCQDRYVDAAAAATAAIRISNISTAVTKIGMLQYVFLLYCCMMLLHSGSVILRVHSNPAVQKMRAGS